MSRGLIISIVSIVFITILSVLVVWPTGPNLRLGGYFKELKIREGLDLRGGTHLVYVAQTDSVEFKDRAAAVQSVVNVIERRVNALGVAEPVIQTTTVGGQDAVIVELPGIQDVQQATDLIGKTAQLAFYEQGEDPSVPATSLLAGWKKTDLTGKDLVKAGVEVQNTAGGGTTSPTGASFGEPVVTLKFNGDGAKRFAAITKRNLQKPVAIVLDDDIISAPTVQSEIKDGNAIITGQRSVEEARNLAKILNAGALPVPITLVEERTVGATLGAESVKKSVVAGLIGLALVALFMMLLYRLPGVIATVALGIYALVVLSLFKLIPVTITLAGIAGFILSVGMAVDANILIFERMKEERRAGKPLNVAIEEGFRRAWTSVRDSNFTSILTSLILIWLGSGIVRGFAVTLLIGILVSLFTAVTVTRTFLRILSRSALARFLG